VRLIHKILSSVKLLSAGHFSPHSTSAAAGNDRQTKIDAYAKAYDLRRSAPAAAREEFKRLAKPYES
jgi:hypothetical protein